MTYQERVFQTPRGPITQRSVLPQWTPWVQPGFLAAVKKLNARSGYRLTTGDTVDLLTGLAGDEARMTHAGQIRDRTHVAPTAALRVIFRDDHLKRLYENSRAQELLKVLVKKGYQWNAADTEFIYHLAQRRAWRRRIADPKRDRVTVDLREIKFAYLEEQLKRPELRAAIRQNVREDLADLFTEFGGLFAFDPNGDLVLVPLPSLFERANDPENNGNFGVTPWDEANMRWYPGRFFAFYHNHAVAALKIITRASTPDRALARSFRNEIALNIVIAAEPAPDGPLRIEAYTAASLQKETGILVWNEPEDALYFLHKFLHWLKGRRAGSAARTASRERPRAVAGSA